MFAIHFLSHIYVAHYYLARFLKGWNILISRWMSLKVLLLMYEKFHLFPIFVFKMSLKRPWRFSSTQIQNHASNNYISSLDQWILLFIGKMRYTLKQRYNSLESAWSLQRASAYTSKIHDYIPCVYEGIPAPPRAYG